MGMKIIRHKVGLAVLLLGALFTQEKAVAQTNNELRSFAIHWAQEQLPQLKSSSILKELSTLPNENKQLYLAEFNP